MNDLTTQSQGIDANNESLVSSGPPLSEPHVKRSRRRMNAPLIGTSQTVSLEMVKPWQLKLKPRARHLGADSPSFRAPSQSVAAHRLLTPIAVMQ